MQLNGWFSYQQLGKVSSKEGKINFSMFWPFLMVDYQVSNGKCKQSGWEGKDHTLPSVPTIVVFWFS